MYKEYLQNLLIFFNQKSEEKVSRIVEYQEETAKSVSIQMEWKCSLTFEFFYTEGICYDFLENLLHSRNCKLEHDGGIWVSKNAEHYMKSLRAKTFLFNIDKKCKKFLFDLLCIQIYQPCVENGVIFTLTSGLCNKVKNLYCKDFWNLAEALARLDNIAKYYIPNKCEHYVDDYAHCENKTTSEFIQPPGML